MSNYAIGRYIKNNKRLKNKSMEEDGPFLRNIFTQSELDYCFSNGKPSQHLCTRFCTKEAIMKALHSIDIKDVFLNQIEILNTRDGCPYVVMQKYKNLNVMLPLSHCKEYSIANTLITLNNTQGAVNYAI